MVEPNGHACKYPDAPIGLFMYEGRMGVKTKLGYAYIEPGELFFGTWPEHCPENLAVQPVKLVWESCSAE
jgi:hypothetical protein